VLDGEKRLFFSPRDFLRNEGWLRPDRAANVVHDVVTSDDYRRRPACGVAHAPADAGLVAAGDVAVAATDAAPVAARGVVRTAADAGLRAACSIAVAASDAVNRSR
jgi:hypothetical protein